MVTLARSLYFVAVRPASTGLRFRIEDPLRQASVMLPALALADFGTTVSTGQAVIENDLTQVRVRFGSQVVVVPADPAHDSPGWLGLRRLHGGSGDMAISVELFDLELSEGGIRTDGRERVDDVRLAEWQNTFDSAWRILIEEHPDRARAMMAGLTGVIVIPDHAESPFTSATRRDAFGYVEAEFPATPLALAEILVHEFQHSKLYAMMDLFPLHDYSPEAIYFAPWRGDARPVDGLIQGAYAFATQDGCSDAGDVLRTIPEVLYALYHEISRRHTNATPPGLVGVATWLRDGSARSSLPPAALR